MSWSFRIARVAGIDIKIHFTFVLVLAWFGYIYYERGGVSAAVSGVLFICLLFLCVLLHEFGHAFAARAYGIRTPDITLLPIGGIARLEQMPRKPSQELVIAIAGPAVNVAIALVLLAVLAGSVSLEDLESFDQPTNGMLVQLLSVNVILVAFNLIPAFPMDGGRIFRALLATRLSFARATRIAGRVGQGIAVLFVIGGLFGNPFLLLIGVFVFLGAGQEASQAEVLYVARGLRLADAMITQFASLPASWEIARAATEVQRDGQPVYPVVNQDLRLAGLVERDQLINAWRTGGGQSPVSSLAFSPPTAAPADDFGTAIEAMTRANSGVLVVTNPAGQPIGLLTIHLLREHALRARQFRA